MSSIKPIIFIGFALVFALVCAGLEFRSQQAGDEAMQITAHLSAQVSLLDAESKRIVRNPESIVWSALEGSHFLIDRLNIIAWSHDEFLPDVRMLQDSFTVRLLQVSAGDFLLSKHQISAHRFLLSVLPLYKKFPILNRYLTPHLNKSVFQNFTGRIVSPDASAGWEIALSGKPIFRFVVAENAPLQSLTSLVAASLSIISFIAAIIIFLYQKHKQRRFQFVFLVATITYVIVRIGMVEMNFPGRWYTSKIFSPQEFASSTYNASLGDLFLNSLGILVLCGYAFLTFSKWPLLKKTLSTQGRLRWIGATLLLLMALFSFLYPFLFFETLFHNSAISLDITQTLAVDWLRILAFLSMLMGTISAFFFTHIFLQSAKSLSKQGLNYLSALLAAVVLFTVYFLIESRDYWITLSIVIPYAIVFYFTNVGSSLRRISYVTFLYLFLAITAYSLQGALSVKRFVEEERVESQFRFAASYLDRDVLAEYLLNESIRRISMDAFIQNRFASPFLGKAPARQKIKQIYLNSYFDRYDVQIHLFNSLKEPFDDQTPNDYHGIESLMTPENSTEYKDIYFIRSQRVQTGKRYVALIPITRSDQNLGYVTLDLSLKRIIPQNVFPELLVDSRFNEYFENRDKSFAFMADKSILSSFGNFNYERDFDFSLLKKTDFYRVGIRKAGFIHAGMEDETGKVAVVTALGYSLFFMLTNFSFFFVLGIFLLGFGLIVYGGVTWFKGDRINYAARIQLYIYLAFAIPLMIVAITTLNRVSKSAETQLNQEFQSKSRLLGENFTAVLVSYLHNPELRSELESQLTSVAKFSNLDVSLYDHDGKLIATSQPVIVENQLTSGRMNRQAWERIFEHGDNALVLNEQIGSLRFNNSYFGLKSPESGLLMGALSVPFFESALSLEATQISVLANIVTVFVIIFILFSILSFFAVNSLTFPLRFITRTLSRTTLTGTNVQLEWKSNDEIGVMVTEYNRMVENLEQSKIELARSQKETAWREIAKQVAHEIKNPLTPMKLTLQQMEYAISKGELEKTKAEQSIKTLLTQVEILNEIASSFSSFARMPAPIQQRVDVVSLLQRSVDLYENYEGGSVSFQERTQPVFVMGDDQLLNRIFSNIILNGLQSGDGKRIQVDVRIRRETSEVVISFEDNGKGIDQELKERIFTPYFSTKKSGSGLGLAIAKQGIEQSGGEIWFESLPGKGSVFYIRLALA